jgi:hypothetical protein
MRRKKMKKSKTISLICLIIGIILIVICLVGKGLEIFETYKALFGIMLGVGSGLFGGSIGHLYNIYILNKYPEINKIKKIEMNDERNIYINNMAKSRAFEVMEYVYPIVIFIIVLLNVDLVVSIILLIAYLLSFAVYIFYSNKYSKEM